MVDRLGYLVVFFLGGVVKLVPIFLFFNGVVSVGVGVFFVVFLTVVVRLGEMFMVLNNLKVYLVWSSNVNLRWVVVLLCWFWGFGLLYYFVYLFLFFFVCVLLKENVLFVDQIYYVRNLGVFFLFLIFLSFSGFPPFLGFFYKYLIYCVLSLEKYIGVVVF